MLGSSILYYYYYFHKSKISVVNSILGSRNIIVISKIVKCERLDKRQESFFTK